MPFNDFLRGLPYIKTTISRVARVQFENGVEQARDVWGGRTKEQFDIRFNVNTKAEIMAVRAFFIANIGVSFPFTDPVDDVERTMRFVADTFRIERRYYGTYFGSCKLIEVF
jgi:phage-related protein